MVRLNYTNFFFNSVTLYGEQRFGILYRKTRDSPGFQDLKQSPINRLPKTIWKRAASVNIFSRNFLWKSIIGRNDLNRLLLIKHCNRLFLTSDQLRQDLLKRGQCGGRSNYIYLFQYSRSNINKNKQNGTLFTFEQTTHLHSVLPVNKYEKLFRVLLYFSLQFYRRVL